MKKSKASEAAPELKWPTGGVQWNPDWTDELPVVRGIHLPAHSPMASVTPGLLSRLSLRFGTMNRAFAWKHRMHYSRSATQLNRSSARSPIINLMCARMPRRRLARFLMLAFVRPSLQRYATTTQKYGGRS